MKPGYSYRDSHKYAEKGAEYEAYYQERPWQRFLWSREQQVLLKILEKYFAGKDVHLLDFACGTGRVTGFLEGRVKTCTAVDVSQSMLAIARERLTRTELIEADITVNDVLKDRRFNLITAFRFFVNAEPGLRTAAIRALAGLLSEDGYLVFNNHQNLGAPWIRVQYLWHHWKRLDSIFNVMTVGQMKNLVGDVGLKVVELYPVGFLNPPKIRMPERLRDAVEGVGSRWRFLSRFSESPIAVCSRRTGC